MGVGLHRMNVHVIRHATQAFAQVILAEGPEAAAQGVAICYDCRNHSEEFAQEAAGVMAANGIPVRLFEAMRPTPELSFAVREYGCIAGLNVTASHNPQGVQRLQGVLVRTVPSCPPSTPPPSPRRWRSWTCLTACVPWTTSRPWTRA